MHFNNIFMMKVFIAVISIVSILSFIQLSNSWSISSSYLRGKTPQRNSELSMNDNNNNNNMFKKITTTTLLSLGLSLSNTLIPINSVQATETSTTPNSNNNKNQEVYFGVGCFWHVQHEFVEAEKSILNRQNNELTSYAGYAGGTKVGKDVNHPDNNDGVVCYHNMMGIGDYGKLGHTEVVNMNIPINTISSFADTYFKLYGSDSERPDKGDRGTEYRSVIGLPGGIESPYLKDVQLSLDRSGKKLKLVSGLGNDKDTLGKGIVYVMDNSNNKFPFYPGEIYHQFHDGFMPGEQYPQSYNSIAKTLYDQGKIKFTGCPDNL